MAQPVSTRGDVKPPTCPSGSATSERSSVSSTRSSNSSGTTVPNPAIPHPYRPPDPPENHPDTRRTNAFRRGDSCDYSRVWQVKLIVDCMYEDLHRCYLVQWETYRTELSWVWQEELSKMTEYLAKVD